MVDAINTSAEVIAEIGSIGRWIEAIGVVIFLWIGFQLFNLFLNWRRKKKLTTIRDDLERIENKLDRVLKDKKKAKK